MALDESVGDVTETASMIGTVYCCQEHLDKQTTPYKTIEFLASEVLVGISCYLWMEPSQLFLPVDSLYAKLSLLAAGSSF